MHAPTPASINDTVNFCLQLLCAFVVASGCVALYRLLGQAR